jgi:hypothetical protein
MEVHTVFSGAVAAGLTLTLTSLGCGGAQEESTVVYRSLEIGAIHAPPNQSEEVELPEATRQQIKACMDRRAGQWSERSYAVQYDAKATDRGAMVEVKLRDTTLHDDEVEGCLRRAIAAMTVPEHAVEQALRSRSSRPVSGGERMNRERRGPLGSSDSENPLVLLGPFIVEAIGVEVLIETGVMIVAAIGTLVEWKKKDPKDECLDKYVACQDTPLGNLVVDKWGHTVCETCRSLCQKDGFWPSGFQRTQGWQTCR